MSEQLPKEFEKTTEVLPFKNYGLSSFENFKKTEEQILDLERLRKIGLSSEEIKLYQDNETGLLEQRKKIDSQVLKGQLDIIYNKINNHQNVAGSSKESEEPAASEKVDIFERIQKRTITFYPDGHPMNDIKELEHSLFNHLKSDIIPITKRRKILRRLERRKTRILAEGKQLVTTIESPANVPQKQSLWDVKKKSSLVPKADKQKAIIGPKKQTLYSIQDNKIVRLEPVERPSEERSIQGIRDMSQEYRAVDIVIPINDAEEQLLEGTKMSVDDIRKIERFKDYDPGAPSKVLYLKNIAPSVNQEQLSLLFNQFQLENGGPIDVRLMAGRMRGQAFVSFQYEDLAIRALEEVNGTILSGKPVIIQFGRNTNRIHDDNT